MYEPEKAVWIGSDHAFDLHVVYLNFRRDIDFTVAPKVAKLSITADSRYRLWINGSYICRGPSRCWPHAQKVDEIDISAHLKSGTNCIAIQVYSPGYSHFAYVHRGACGLLAWLECDGKSVLLSDQSWRVQRDPSWNTLVPRVSIYGSGIEVRDLNLERLWQTALPEGPEWKTPRIVSPANGTIWSGLTMRDVPLLIEEKVPLSNLWQFKRATHSFNSAEPHEAMRQLFTMGKPGDAPAMPVHLDEGETAIWIYDLGSSKVGIGAVEIEGAFGGETLLVSYAEKLRDGELVLSDPATYCRMRPTDMFTLREGRQTAESFSQRGGRYLVFALHARQSGMRNLSFYFRQTRYPLQEKPGAIAEPALAKISALCRTTVLNCLQDGFVDSVWRESSQWLGDCVTEAFALSAISDDLRPLRRAITMAADGVYEDGILPSVLPGEVHAYAITDYNFSWVELLHMYVSNTKANDGDVLLAQMLPVLKNMLARFRLDLDSKGLLNAQPGRRLFLDWSAVDRREPNLTYNGRYLYALQLAQTLAKQAGAHSLAKVWHDDALTLADSIKAAFRQENTWTENRHGTPASQLGLALMVLTGMVQGAAAQTTANAIIDRSLDPDDDPSSGKLVLASPFMHHYVFLALQKVGLTEAILEIIRARWGRWAEAGEATTWENWNTDFPDGSRCHGFSAHPLGWIELLAK